MFTIGHNNFLEIKFHRFELSGCFGELHKQL